MQSSILRRKASQTSRTSLKSSLRAPTRRRTFVGKLCQPASSFSRCHSTLFIKPTNSIPKAVLRQQNRSYSSQTTDIVFSDPNRPDLFYHFVHPPTPLSQSLPAFALSFLDVTPPAADSPVVIGWLPAQTYMTDTPETPGSEEEPKEQSSGLQDFVVNPKFVTLLQETIKSGLKENVDDIWENGGKQLQEGWMHIHDQRNIPALGRIGDPDDIIASVLVEDSKIKYDTYQPMPSYRVCTSDGILQLTPGLAEHLRAALIRLTKTEAAS
ncbi:hypothetical protein BDZ97DRAFT_1104457 [Flammula alnicola]|nr:hypothetical protein BDZ97DRAFT_1104457 [Flammula alnicola]